MKITDPHVIKNGEKDLIEAVTDDLDLDAVKEILKKRMAAAALSSKGGEIIVHNNEIAFRLDFDIQLSGSLMFDRQGNYVPESDETGAEESNDPDDPENLVSEDFDLEDIDINETLLNDTEDAEIEESENTMDDLEELTDESGSEPEIEDDDIVDDDISNILEENREFWEPKKDS